MNTLFWLLLPLGVLVVAVVVRRIMLRKELRERKEMLHHAFCNCERFDDSIERFRLKKAIKEIEAEHGFK